MLLQARNGTDGALSSLQGNHVPRQILLLTDHKALHPDCASPSQGKKLKKKTLEKQL